MSINETRQEAKNLFYLGNFKQAEKLFEKVCKNTKLRQDKDLFFYILCLNKQGLHDIALKKCQGEWLVKTKSRSQSLQNAYAWTVYYHSFIPQLELINIKEINQSVKAIIKLSPKNASSESPLGVVCEKLLALLKGDKELVQNQEFMRLMKGLKQEYFSISYPVEIEGGTCVIMPSPFIEYCTLMNL